MSGGCGGQPLLTIQAVMALPSLKSKGISDPQTALHSDTFHPTAKAWLFLKDVGEDDGPFSYVPGSHRMTPERLAWERRISENPSAMPDVLSARGSLRANAADMPALGYGAPVPIVAKANTLVVADTHGFHARCPSPKTTTRIEIYGSLRRNPFLPVVGLHAHSLPFIRSRMNRLMIRIGELGGKLGFKGAPWRAAGRGTVAEWSKRLARGEPK